MRSVLAPHSGWDSAVEARGVCVQLQLRGSGCILRGGQERFELEPKDALLLAYLALEGPTSRARLATLLWPDVDEERARGNLRQRLLRLRRAAGVELVVGQPVAQLADGVARAACL